MEQSESSKEQVEISNDQALIKDSQEDIVKTDVLVCGNCFAIYYFLEEFQQHKTAKDCVKPEAFDCANEEKPQVWAFVLWKNKQLKVKREFDDELPSPWDMYQKWIKLKQSEKNVWIAAGQSLLYCHRIGASKIELIPIEKTKDKNQNDNIEKSKNRETQRARRTSTENGKEEFIVEKIVGKRFNPKRRFWEYHVKWENCKEETWEPIDHLENCKDLIQEYEDKVKASKPTPPAPTRGRGRPRLNPIGTPGSTPVKVVKKPTPPTATINTPSAVTITTPGGRPQRTSKQKALNQVKQWCGNISDSDEQSNKRPYDDADDSDDSFEKKMKLDGESEDTEEEEPPLTVKKSPKIIQYNNGVGKKIPDNVLIPDAKGVVRISQKQLPSLSSGVYIMSRSSGIIKLDPAASKIATSGGQAIVKVGPKIGQTQIKIIKKEGGVTKTNIITPITTATATATAATTSSSIISPKIDISSPKIEKPPSPKPTRLIPQIVKTTVPKKEVEKIVKKAEPPKLTVISPIIKKEEPKSSNKSDDESDYGLEDLEFPTDLPLPEPESPPGDFVLDPTTGKIAGQTYPDPPPEPEITEIKDTPSETIDNIVKLAAADITEEDLKPDEPVVTTAAPSTIIESSTVPVIATPPPPPSSQTLITTATVVATPPTTVVGTIISEQKPAQQSILNTALANSNILQKTLLTPTNSPRQKVQPKILNQAMAKQQRTSNIHPIIKNVVTPRQNQIARSRSAALTPTTITTPKPRFNIAPVNTNLRNVQNVYTKTNSVAKKVNNTGFYKRTYGGPSQIKQMQHNTTTHTQKASILKEVPTTTTTKTTAAINTTPKAVISMPSLAIDEEPSSSTAVAGTSANITPTNAATTTNARTATQGVKQTQQQQVAVITSEADLTQFALAADSSERMYITGDDGTVYQVAGQNEEGQTILLTQDSDGQQQCLLVTNETVEGETQQVTTENSTEMMEVQQEAVEMNEEQPVVAQLLRTEPPSPGGTHKVVVMLPTGEVMVTHMSSEEYANLELDK